MTVIQMPIRALRHDVPEGCVSSVEVCRRADITYRQLDYWTRTDLLTPDTDNTPGSGVWRWYPVAQVHRAALINVLLQGGMSLQAIRRVIDDLLELGTCLLHPSLSIHVLGED